MSFLHLSKAQILRAHARTLAKQGGSEGIRDMGMLDAALAMPQATYGGTLLHPTLEAQAAAYLYHLCQNHPFIDGNKRVAALAMLVFCDINGYRVALNNAQLEKLVMDTAASRITKAVITEVIHNALELHR